jgi:hypothetical protein
MTILYNTTTEKLGNRYDPQYLVDGKPGVLPDHIVELAIVDNPRPETTETQTVSQKWVIDIEQREYRQEWTVRELTKRELAPTVITKAQGLLMLKAIGLYDQFKADLASATEEEQIIFDATKEWDINNSLINKMQIAFGMSDDEKCDFFINASKIIV